MGTLNNRSYKTFLVKNFYIFYFPQCDTVPFTFSSIYVILCFSHLNNLVRPIKMEICSDITYTVDAFPGCKDVPSVMGEGTETWIQSWRILLHIANHLFFTVRISKSNNNCILIHFVGWVFHAKMISSNILSLFSLFSQH